MFIPKKFRQENTEELIAMMQKYSFATLITQSEEGIEATHLPVIISGETDKLFIKAHIAKANPLWKSVKDGADVLVIFNGPNCYISPNHYPTKKETGKAVPTWNYVVVHAKGHVSFIHDNEWVYGLIDSLTTVHESNSDQPWSITDAPELYIQKMLPAIVGVQIDVASITGQWKLSQNQPEINQRGVVNGLGNSQENNLSEIASLISRNLQKGE